MSKTGKQNTLFSYFNKSPASVKKECKTGLENNVLSPKRSPNTPGGKKDATKKTISEIEIAFEVGDLVWAKLDGFPWWPSLVCNHPTALTHSKGGKKPELHVQFFDNPTTRSWIKLKNVKPFKGSEDSEYQKGGQFYTYNTECRSGVKEADKAFKLSLEERLQLVVELQPSESEDEGMELDPDIFENEMTDDDADHSKENVDDSVTEQKQVSEKTPDKSKRRSKRQNKVKRRRIIEAVDSDEGSEDEFKAVSSEDSDDSASSGVDEDEISEPETESEIDSPVKKLTNKRKKPGTSGKAPKRSAPSTPNISLSAKKANFFKPSVSENTKSKLAAFSAPDMGESLGPENDGSHYPHLKLDFLQPDQIRDINRKHPTDPDYDPKTLYIPESYLKNTTPAMRQWWEMKSKYFDTILFFKMGKFYELFHMDAAVAVNELGLIYMKGDYAHSGFPEIAYGRYAETLIQKGYKVGRIEQTETPEMMADRVKSMSRAVTKFDKVVKREVCQITSKGTMTYSFRDGDTGESRNNYLLAVSEKEGSSSGCYTYGVCFIDTSIGKFHVGQFDDDRYCSRFRTLIAHYVPSQILYERGKFSQKTMQIINTNLTSAVKDALSSGTEFWDSSKTMRILAEEDYFKEDDKVQWPDTLKAMMSEVDTLGLTVADDYDLAVSALGALIWYLQYSLKDVELLSMRNFEMYRPLDDAKISTAADFTQGRQHMILDGITLKNLDVIENSNTGTIEGTLLEKMNHCSTAFGRRLFRQWLCSPLCNPSSINDRLDAVDDLMMAPELVSETTEIMKKLPDFERLLSKIHTLGLSRKSKNHPDGRAILYEEVTYSKRKIEDFLTTIEGFRSACRIMNHFKKRILSFKSKILKSCAGIKGVIDEGKFPDLKDDLDFFEDAFDHKKARKDGVIIPSEGVNPDYDEASSEISSIEKQLNRYLDGQKLDIGCKSLVYWGTGKNRYQIEVPEVAFKRVPIEYELMSSKKGAKRYRTTKIEEYLRQLVEAEDQKDSALRDTMRRIFYNFDERYDRWDSAVQCLAVLDVLICLSQYSKCCDGVMCRPEFTVPGSQAEPFIELREARHPCVARTFSGGDFIPNDTVIGIADENDMETDDVNCKSQIVLVTGPNMGGKSTLMRQVGLITIIAQMGCYVPAEKCRLTPVDRVFTRLGASDRIMAGESTFYVELSETSAIIQHATKHSLVLVDELGRGTATYDGTAIACSVVNELSQSIQCRTLFSTHYHSLVEEFSHDPNIRLGHMACMVENESDDPTQETITFLYKFVKGACPKSYGFNAARLADIPDDVIRVAVKKAKELEDSVNKIKLFKSLWNETSVEKLREIQQDICCS